MYIVYVCNTCSEMYCWYFLVWTERKMSMIFVLPSAVGFFYVWLREHACSRNCHSSGRIHRRFHICKVPSHFRKRSPRLKCYFIIENFSADLVNNYVGTECQLSAVRSSVSLIYKVQWTGRSCAHQLQSGESLPTNGWTIRLNKITWRLGGGSNGPKFILTLKSLQY